MNSLVKYVASVRPRYLPLPFQDSADSGRMILRDGSTATIRVAGSGDSDAIKRFFAGLSSQSRIRRFFASSQPNDKLIEMFCDNSDRRARLTLVVIRMTGGDPRIIALGSYFARDAATAEIAMAVDDRFQGKGIGTLFLERLALLAVANGFRRFMAVTLAENKPMMDVFRNSGFEYRTRLDDGCVEFDLSVIPTDASVVRGAMRDRVATIASLRPFFKPEAVAVVGASRNQANIGNRILRGLIEAGFQGNIYPINPHAPAIYSVIAYPSIRDVPNTPDLAVITVPRDTVLAVIDDCAARGVRALVVITAGFAESGADGKRLQQELVDRTRGHGMRMVGPNCLGLLNTDPEVRLNASFAPHFPPRGSVAFCSQSGALGLAIIALARKRELGLSNFVSVGNKADVSGNDLLQYWDEDQQTNVILLYLESFGNPRRFARIAARVSRHKPIVAVKAGRTGAGGRAAGSHTAALAGSDVAVDALFHQTGVLRAETLDEMFDLAAALSAQPLPGGKHTAVLTNAGGLGILCADTCEANGLIVPELRDATKERLRRFLPASASVLNPVDMIASAGADEFRQATEILLCADEIHSLIVLTIDVGLADIAAIAENIRLGVARARQRGGKGKAVLSCLMDAGDARRSAPSNGEQIPNYPFPENAARALSKLARYAEWRAQAEGIIPEFDDIQPVLARAICQKAIIDQGAGWLSTGAVRAVLAALALPLAAGEVCRTKEQAAAVAGKIGYPVAVKLASREIVHKTAAGGVRLDLKDDVAVRQAFADIESQLAGKQRLEAMDGVLVQPMICGGVELMIGVTDDPSFGPLLGFGLGGIHVEILKDVCFRVTPITDRDAGEMVRSIRGYRLLEGYRGHPPADIAAIETLLLRVARLVEEVPEIRELDLNPVIALPPGQGCLVVDARIRAEP